MLPSKCYVDITGGIGNIIQTIPFIKEVSKLHTEVIANCNPDSPEILPMIHSFFKSMIPRRVPDDGLWYRCPYESKVEDLTYPEYRLWFKTYNIPEPENFDTSGLSHTWVPWGHEVVLWPGCKPHFTFKKWPYWEKLAEMYEDVCVIGNREDGGIFPQHVRDYRGKLNLQETAGLLKNSEILIGNEGGITHLASSFNIKTFIVFGGSHPRKNLPPNTKTVCPISLNLDCQPCHFANRFTWPDYMGCPEKTCLVNMTPEIVFNKVKEIYEQV